MVKKIHVDQLERFGKNGVERTVTDLNAVQSPLSPTPLDGAVLRSVHFRHPADGSGPRGYLWLVVTTNGHTKPVKVPIEQGTDVLWLQAAAIKVSDFGGA